MGRGRHGRIAGPVEPSTGGGDNYGELGNRDHGAQGSRTPLAVSFPEPRAATTSTTVIAVGAQGEWSCAVLAKDGAVWCWGDNHTGQALPGGPSPTPPVAVPGITGATQVVAGHGATCVLEQGNVRCWGVMPIPGGRALVAKPTAIPGLDHIVEIGMGYQVFCGRRDDDSVWCWGQQKTGDLKPEKIDVGGPVRALALGSYGAAALRPDGKVISWWIEQPAGPTEIPLVDITRLSSSGSHTCALDRDGRVFCWGGNLNGQLGNPDQGAGGESKTPIPVPL